MKRIILFLLVITASTNLKAQNLTMAQLLEVKKKDLGHAEDYLVLKGWEFYKASAPTFESLGSATFTYKKDNMSSLAQSFLYFYYSQFSDKTRVSIYVTKKEKYTEYINAIKGYGCKMISSDVIDGKIIKVYRGATTTFQISSETTENFFREETVVWKFILFSNEDYDLHFSY